MARLGTVAAFGILTLVVGCDGSSENTGTTPDTGTSAGAGAPGAGGVGSVSGGTSNGVTYAGGNSTTAGATTSSSSVQSTGGSGNTAGNAGSLGGAVAKSIGGSAAIGGSVSSAGETGVQHAGGAAGASASSGTGTCNYPVCLYDLFSACPAAPPSASCTIQDTTTATMRQTNACYGDGSAGISKVDLTTYASTTTFKKGGATCYTMETSVAVSALGVPTSTFTTLKDGSGNVVATETWDVATDKTTVTCTGAQPVVLNTACDASSDGTYNCQPGVCNP